MGKQQITPTPAMEANRCAVSAKDCNEAKRYLEAYQELKNKDNAIGTTEFLTHCEGLLIAAIISYSRAFTDSRGKEFSLSKAKVDKGLAFNYEDSKMDLHKIILDKRHKVVAHSEWGYRDSQLVSNAKDDGTLRRSSVVDYEQGVDIPTFINITKDMRDYFRQKTYDFDILGAT